MDIFLSVAWLTILLAIFTLFVRWTAADAIKRGKSPWLIALIVVLFFPWGLLAWLIFRPEIETPYSRRFSLDNYRRN